DLEARVVGEGGIEQAQGVGEMDLLQHGHVVATSEGERGGCPLAHTVHGEDGRALEGRGVEPACRMTEMMLGEEQSRVPSDRGFYRLEFANEERPLEELFLEPEGKCVTERGEASRDECEIRFEQSLEFQERLVVEGDVVDLVRPDVRLLEAS